MDPHQRRQEEPPRLHRTRRIRILNPNAEQSSIEDICNTGEPFKDDRRLDKMCNTTDSRAECSHDASRRMVDTSGPSRRAIEFLTGEAPPGISMRHQSPVKPLEVIVSEASRPVPFIPREWQEKVLSASERTTSGDPTPPTGKPHFDYDTVGPDTREQTAQAQASISAQYGDTSLKGIEDKYGRKCPISQKECASTHPRGFEIQLVAAEKGVEELDEVFESLILRISEDEIKTENLKSQLAEGQMEIEILRSQLAEGEKELEALRTKLAEMVTKPTSSPRGINSDKDIDYFRGKVQNLRADIKNWAELHTTTTLPQKPLSSSSKARLERILALTFDRDQGSKWFMSTVFRALLIEAYIWHILLHVVFSEQSYLWASDLKDSLAQLFQFLNPEYIGYASESAVRSFHEWRALTVKLTLDRRIYNVEHSAQQSHSRTELDKIYENDFEWLSQYSHLVPTELREGLREIFIIATTLDAEMKKQKAVYFFDTSKIVLHSVFDPMSMDPAIENPKVTDRNMVAVVITPSFCRRGSPSGDEYSQDLSLLNKADVLLYSEAVETSDTSEDSSHSQKGPRKQQKSAITRLGGDNRSQSTISLNNGSPESKKTSREKVVRHDKTAAYKDSQRTNASGSSSLWAKLRQK